MNLFFCRKADKTSQDLPKARFSRGKDKLILINKAKDRSTCLSKGRSTLFKKGYTLHKRTGVDVLLIVEDKREWRFFGTGNLKTQFMEGTLRSKGSKEVKENYFQGSKNDEKNYVLLLGKHLALLESTLQRCNLVLQRYLTLIHGKVYILY